MKKLLSIIVCLAMVLAMAAVSFAAGSSDSSEKEETLTLTIPNADGKVLEVPKSAVAIDQAGVTPTNYALIVYTPAYTGEGVSAGWGIAIVLNKDGKIVRAYDGTSGNFYDAGHTDGAKDAGCTTAGYAAEAFASRQPGETVIIAPNATGNNTEPGSRWYVHKYGRVIGAEVSGLGLTFGEPEQPANPNSGSIKVEAKYVGTGTNQNYQNIYTFTPEKDGEYTFFVPAGLGVWEYMDYLMGNGSKHYVNYATNTEGASFTLTLTAGKNFKFYVGTNSADLTSGTITWTMAGGNEPETPACRHANTKVEGAKDATCTVAGFTGNTVCTDCGEKVADGREIPTLDHTYVDGKCTCGAEDPNYVPPVDPEQPVDPTGDYTFVFFALLALSMSALVVLISKKRAF